MFAFQQKCSELPIGSLVCSVHRKIDSQIHTGYPKFSDDRCFGFVSTFRGCSNDWFNVLLPLVHGPSIRALFWREDNLAFWPGSSKLETWSQENSGRTTTSFLWSLQFDTYFSRRFHVAALKPDIRGMGSKSWRRCSMCRRQLFQESLIQTTYDHDEDNLIQNQLHKSTVTMKRLENY